MITLLEGVPGAGKTYHAVSEYLLPWVRQGRRLYVHVDGIYLDRLALFTGIPLAELEKQITIWPDGSAVPSLLLGVEPGAAVLLDECQTIFRAQEKVPGDVARWLETHRHLGADVVLMCQDYRQLTAKVTRLVESTIQFRRLDRFGAKGRYQGRVRGNPEETEIIRKILGKYNSTVYAFYSSYSAAGVREVRQMKTLMSSPLVLTGLIALVGALAWMSMGNWLTVPEKASAKEVSVPQLPPPVQPAELKELQQSILTGAEIVLPTTKVRIQGGMVDERGRVFWIDEQGRILTANQIAGLTGTVVQERVQNGLPSIVGAGVDWGGSAPGPVGVEVDAAVLATPSMSPSALTKKRVKCIGKEEGDCER